MSKPTKSHGRKTIAASRTPTSLMDGPGDLAGVWKAKVITLFPDSFPGTLGQSLTGTALKDGLWQLETIDLRPFGDGKHRNVDDTPAGGGAGMVLRADIIGKALDHAAKNTPDDRTKWPVIYLSPRGEPLTQSTAERLSQGDGITLLCGRFEGVDERVLDEFNIEEISLGDFVLTGGEIAAQAMIDATVRLLPGILGNEQSALEESFSNGLLEHPQYTKPTTWRGRGVPEILHSGHHRKIQDWRREMSEKLTKHRRPDLWDAHRSKNADDDG